VDIIRSDGNFCSFFLIRGVGESRPKKHDVIITKKKQKIIGRKFLRGI
jgi:hypothetical protein